MELCEHVRVTGGALRRWLVAQSQDALCVAVLWLVGLAIIGVPWAPLWAVLGAFLQFVPHLGPAISLIGPAVAAAASGGFMQMIYVFVLYAAIVFIDGIILQPYLMRRTAKVPIWASILTPIVLGLFFSFWGVLLAAPLLAVVYAYRARKLPRDSASQPPSGPWTGRSVLM